MTDRILAALRAANLISAEQDAAIATYEREKPFSLYYELRTLLSLGVTLLSTGLGLLIYKNIDTLGHGVLVALIALLSAAGFTYAFRKRQPFTWGMARNSTGADYALLLACLTLLTLVGYLQYQYTFFGTRYGLLVLLPTLVFFYCAYRFDHRGVLSMALTGLAAWVGVSVAPVSAFTSNDYELPHLDAIAIGLGLLLAGVGLASEYLDRKKHFSYTYLLLGSNLALVALLTAMFRGSFEQAGFLPPVLAALLIIVLSGALYWYARHTHSYVFVLLGALYGYIAVTYLFFQLEESGRDMVGLAFVYFPASAVGVVLLLLNLKKIVGSHEQEGV
ncbi:DUF2157 domain-containing protein [Hymenobacter chitinivorans]|uniref:Putative membrane protein DUF2157 n=1 Tax=Hymenobacter chitinivorans DSM 11115 TaxID=1121954 RepID=A0A2M9BTA2_9BACT|nr:DUF2157 domain-containing protein [Hymenobacter chitinivorans]PJJ61163.1 putative membrane protein DUF2157 [Hymenobacter chitinivorans DSM 11115]